jgi:hypothetical protein
MKVTGLNEFVLELDVATSRMLPEVEKVVGFGCNSIKKDWAAAWSSLGKHLPAISRSINYDVFILPGRIVGEVGPDLGRPQGPLGGIVEFGTPGHNAPHPGGAPALDKESPKFEAAMLALTFKLLPP